MPTFPNINDFYAEHPNVLEALKLMRPEGNGPEYDEQRKAYERLLHTVAASYALWSVGKPWIFEKEHDHDE
jgi:hypothetical protein